jgi:hypothetical protein
MLCMLDGLLTWTAHSEHQEVWAGPSWSSIALRYDVAFIWSIKPFISHVCSVACVNSLACLEGGVSLHAFLLERCYFVLTCLRNTRPQSLETDLALLR